MDEGIVAALQKVTATEEEVLSYFDSLSNWGRWGDDDEFGTLNHVSADKRVAAARLVQTGETVSCAWDIGGDPPADQPFGPPQRLMLATGQGLSDEHRVTAPWRAGDRSAGALEHLGLVYHGHTVTHVDALSHIFWDGRMYNDRPAELVASSVGATSNAVTALRDGVITRGVLLDVASARDVDWLEPGDAVFPEDLERCESLAGGRVDEGDVVLMRTGYGKKVREKGPDEVAKVGRAGWHATCLPWLHDRGVAMIACDTAQDAHPSGYKTIRSPIHSIGVVAMGLWLIDNCDLEALAARCNALGRFEFMFVLAPLRWVGATGSPANPIATF